MIGRLGRAAAGVVIGVLLARRAAKRWPWLVGFGAWLARRRQAPAVPPPGVTRTSLFCLAEHPFNSHIRCRLIIGHVNPYHECRTTTTPGQPVWTWG